MNWTATLKWSSKCNSGGQQKEHFWLIEKWNWDEYSFPAKFAFSTAITVKLGIAHPKTIVRVSQNIISIVCSLAQYISDILSLKVFNIQQDLYVNIYRKSRTSNIGTAIFFFYIHTTRLFSLIFFKSFSEPVLKLSLIRCISTQNHCTACQWDALFVKFITRLLGVCVSA